MEAITITRIDCPELPERTRYRVARGEHTIATFAKLDDARVFMNTIAEPPLVAGGQGRSDLDVEGDATSMARVIAVVIALLLLIISWVAICNLCL
jgi:hypothetical protein